VAAEFAIDDENTMSSKQLVDYQDTTTWPSWAHRPPSDIGIQCRIFEVLEVSDSSVTFWFGLFCYWTLPSKELENAIAKARALPGVFSSRDQHGFEHFGGIESFDNHDAQFLMCPKWSVVNCGTIDESIVDRDLTILADQRGSWLFQYRKLKVQCIYSLDTASFPFDEQKINMQLTLREEIARRFVSIDHMPSIMFVRCSKSVANRWEFKGAKDKVGVNINRGAAIVLEVHHNGFLGFKCRTDLSFQILRKPNYYLINYLAVVYATCLLSFCPWGMPDGGVSSKLEFSASLVLTIIAIRLTYAQEVGACVGSELTWMDKQMLTALAFMFLMCFIQLLATRAPLVYATINVASIAVALGYPLFVWLKLSHAAALE
jgi:hypothetical protein